MLERDPDHMEEDEFAGDVYHALDHLREIEKLARRHCWLEVLPHLVEIECALPEV